MSFFSVFILQIIVYCQRRTRQINAANVFYWEGVQRPNTKCTVLISLLCNSGDVYVMYIQKHKTKRAAECIKKVFVM